MSEEKISIAKQYFNQFARHLEPNGFQMPHTDETWSHPPQFISLICPKPLLREEIAKNLTQIGIETRQYFTPPCHRMKAFALTGYVINFQ